MVGLQSHHVGIVVSDLEEAVEFYRDTLGLEILAEFTLDGDAIANAIDVEGVAGDFVHLDAGGSRVELIEYAPDGGDAVADAVNQIGAIHVGFEVDDISSFYEDLPADAEPLSEPQRTDTGSQILFFSDPDGNFVEVLETA